MIRSLLRHIAFGEVGNIGEIQNTFKKLRQRGGKGLWLHENVGPIRQSSQLPRASIYLCERNGRVTATATVRIPPRTTTNHSRSIEYSIICDRKAAHSWCAWQKSYERSLYHNVFHLVIGQPPVMGHYFNFVKSNKIYNHQPTIVFEKLRFSSSVVLH